MSSSLHERLRNYVNSSGETLEESRRLAEDHQLAESSGKDILFDRMKRSDYRKLMKAARKDRKLYKYARDVIEALIVALEPSDSVEQALNKLANFAPKADKSSLPNLRNQLRHIGDLLDVKTPTHFE